jgi:hypothetical protein
VPRHYAVKLTQLQVGTALRLGLAFHV